MYNGYIISVVTVFVADIDTSNRNWKRVRYNCCILKHLSKIVLGSRIIILWVSAILIAATRVIFLIYTFSFLNVSGKIITYWSKCLTEIQNRRLKQYTLLAIIRYLYMSVWGFWFNAIEKHVYFFTQGGFG